MFTPTDVPADTYRVYVTESPIEDVLAAFREAAPAAGVPGAWTAQAMDALDAYGQAGPYNRAKVARLYVGVRPRVARGPIVLDGRTVRSVTLVSPYPDAALSHLSRGTLIIEFVIPGT